MRNRDDDRAGMTRSFTPALCEATVTAVGRSRATSMAKVGPDRTATGASGRASAAISLISAQVSCSIPLEQMTAGTSLGH